jgi:hypothetical protein
MAGNNHIKPIRLFDMTQAEDASSFQLTEEEKQHLRACEECQDVVVIFARQFRKHRPLKDKLGAA